MVQPKKPNSIERPTSTSWTGWTPVGGLPLPGTAAGPDHRVAFVLRLGHTLHTSGYAAHRLEEALELASDHLGLRGQFFSTPTSIMASFGPQDDQQTFLIRVEPGESNLGKLAQADEVTREVLNGRLTPFQLFAYRNAILSAARHGSHLLFTSAVGDA